MMDYEIRYLKATGSLAMQCAAKCESDDEARQVVRAMRSEGEEYEIWRGMQCIECSQTAYKAA